MKPEKEIAVFGGGCFWCTEAIFGSIRGVESVMPGYAGGMTKNPTYERVCSGKTGHAEVTRVEFDPSVIPYKDLLDVFFHTHDPTSLNQQGADAGTEYRSIIFYTTDAQKQIAESLIKELDASGELRSKIVTEIKPLENFYEAEENQKQYYAKNSYMPYCQIVISPKLDHLREKYRNKLK
jgi:peptide-methionine (S)-S-oxide reductase